MTGSRRSSKQLLDAATQAARSAALDRATDLRFGIVDAIDTGAGTITVTVGGSTLYDIPYMGQPVVAGPAWLLHQGSMMVCLGMPDGGAGGIVGLPAGGATGEVLTKTDGTDFNADWAAAPNMETFFMVAISDEVTDLTTGTAKVTIRAPFAMTLTAIPTASLSTTSSSGNPTFDINVAGSSVLGANKLSIDSGEKTSTTAATATTLATTSVAADAEITFDIDTAGTGAKGAKITVFYRRT
jgi:hypothetical protein